MTKIETTEEFLARGGHVMVARTEAAQGLKRSKYIKREFHGFGDRAPAEPINSGDPKFDMYANALPRAIRQTVVDQGLDVRALYKEYRTLGAAAMVEKYAPKD